MGVSGNLWILVKDVKTLVVYDDLLQCSCLENSRDERAWRAAV